MSLRTKISKFIGGCSNEVGRLKNKITESDFVVIGAGAGLSVAAGYTYSGERFEKYFSDFREKYFFGDMYSGGFYPYETPEEFWAFWCRNIFVNRYTDPPNKKIFYDLLNSVRDKNYFVITTNVDHCFQKFGFDKEKLFYTQGDYGLFQCSTPCHKKTYDNEKIIREMMSREKDMKIPTELIPHCPKCGEPMTTNLRIDDTFVEDEGWHKASERYKKFLANADGAKILFLELGVGGNTPGIIKFPFWRMTLENPAATYVCINSGEIFCPEEIKSQSILIDRDIGEVLKELVE